MDMRIIVQPPSNVRTLRRMDERCGVGYDRKCFVDDQMPDTSRPVGHQECECGRTPRRRMVSNDSQNVQVCIRLSIDDSVHQLMEAMQQWELIGGNVDVFENHGQ